MDGSLVGRKGETTTAVPREVEKSYEAPQISVDNRDDVADSIGEKVKCVSRSLRLDGEGGLASSGEELIA